MMLTPIRPRMTGEVQAKLMPPRLVSRMVVVSARVSRLPPA
jgi:hypothetical protein